jgi:hypothetical protein
VQASPISWNCRALSFALSDIPSPVRRLCEGSMGFYIRRSVKAGPFRLNLSKSGIGVSAGIPGLRVGSSPRGSYVHMGGHGVYYRQTLSSPKQRSSSPRPASHNRTIAPSAQLVWELPKVTPVDLTDSSPSALVEDLNRSAGRFRFSPLT